MMRLAETKNYVIRTFWIYGKIIETRLANRDKTQPHPLRDFDGFREILYKEDEEDTKETPSKKDSDDTHWGNLGPSFYGAHCLYIFSGFRKDKNEKNNRNPLTQRALHSRYPSQTVAYNP